MQRVSACVSDAARAEAKQQRAYHCAVLDSRNCIAHSCDCDYAMKPRKGLKRSGNSRAPPLPPPPARLGESRSDSDATLASLSSDDTVVGVSPAGWPSANGQVAGALVVPPSYFVLPPTQKRLFHHMESIAQDIETGRASNLVIYLKRLPT